MHHTDAEREIDRKCSGRERETLSRIQHGHPLFLKVGRGMEQRRMKRKYFVNNVIKCTVTVIYTYSTMWNIILNLYMQYCSYSMLVLNLRKIKEETCCWKKVGAGCRECLKEISKQSTREMEEGHGNLVRFCLPRLRLGKSEGKKTEKSQ